jgi:3-oxoacyl-[acyl-carrier protein] reductase
MKIALVTGASRGLGAVIARELGAAGWAVAVNYANDAKSAEAVVEKIRAAGGTAVTAKFNVVDKEAIRSGIDTIRTMLGSVDLIVNNATGPQPQMPLMEQSWQTYVDQFEFFVKAPLELLQAVLPDWRARRSGRVINIGSEVVELGNPNFGNYVSAKGAMLAMSRSWARELAPDGITVNVVSPGWIPVERHASADRIAMQDYTREVPAGHMGSPEDIAHTVVFLASEHASFITGQKIAVNGGRTLL